MKPIRIDGDNIAWILAGGSGVNLLFAAAALANKLQITFFLYNPQIVHIVFLSPLLDLSILLASSVLTIILLAVFRTDKWTIVGLALILVTSGYLLTVGSEIAGLFGASGLLLFAAFSIWSRLKHLDRMEVEFTARISIMLLGLIGVVEVWALPHWLFYPVVKDVASHAAELEIQLFYLPYLLIPIVYVVFLFSWILFPIHLRSPYRLLAQGSRPEKRNLPHSRREGYLLLCLAVLVGLFVALYPYFKTTSRLVGVDIDCCYMPNLERTLALGPFSMFASDRPLFWVLLYLFQLVTSLTPFQVLFILSPLLTVATSIGSFVLVKVGTRDLYAAGWAAFISAVLFNTTAAIFMDLFTNWLTMVFVLFYFALLILAFRFQRHWVGWGLIAVLLSIVLLFLHPYTWEVTILVTVLFVILRVLLSERRRQVAPVALLYLALLVALNFLAYNYRLSTGGIGGGIGLGVSLTSLTSFEGQPLSFEAIAGKLMDPVGTFGTFWFNLGFFLRLTGVHYADWLTPALGFLGMLHLYRRGVRDSFTLLMVAWMFVSSAFTVLMGNFAAPYYNPSTYMPFIWRAFFFTPFQVPAGIALANIRGRYGSSMLFFVVALVLVNHALRSLATLLF